MAAHMEWTMPLMEDDPPSNLPLGQDRRRPPRWGSGSDSKPQLYLFMFMGMESAVGMRMSGLASEPPYSNSNNFVSGSSVKRLASTHPADPAPTTM